MRFWVNFEGMTKDAIKPLVVIPLYNHAATVRDVAQNSLTLLPDVLVVDDGSSDAGAAVLSGLPLEVVRHPVNRGKGAAILTALDWAAARGFTHLFTLDADGQHDPADLSRFLAAVAARPDAIHVGERDFNTANVPGSSRFGRQFSNFWLRVQTGCKLADVQSGYRAYPVWVLRELELGQAHFSFEVEVLVKAAWAGIQLCDVPVSVHYPPADQRISHFNKLWDNWRLSMLNTRLTLRSALPWPHRRLVGTALQKEKVSLWHPLRSLRRVLAENATPAELALAVMLGVVLGALPLVGVQTLTILVAAGMLRLNKAVAVAAAQLCMPPLMPALCVELGHFLRHGRWLTEISLQTLGHEAPQRLWEWLLGGLLLGPLAGAATALVVYLTARSLSRHLERAHG
jgi:glycosyltransferase involved in cell wall biosynthesis